MKHLSEVIQLFQHAPFEWYVCGGEAIDLFLGMTTRNHKDVDIGVFWKDRRKIIDFMLNAGWRVFEFCGNGQVHELFDSAKPARRNLFCFTSENTNCRLIPINNHTYRFNFVPAMQNNFNYVEFLFNQRDGNNFLYHWNNSIMRALHKAILEVNGVRILSPEIVLLYKSINDDATYEGSAHNGDFYSLLPFLDNEQKLWLQKALEIEHSKTHQWVHQLIGDKM